MIELTAIIPARGGSKGIKRKNLYELCGKPLISYTIQAAKDSRYVKDIIISTDSPKIAEIAASYGARVPFMRPKKLAADNSRRNEVIFHALDWLRNHDNLYKFFIYLQPTSPLRDSIEIDNAVEFLLYKNGRAVLSVTEAKYNLCLFNTLPDDLRMSRFFENSREDFNRQEMPTYYRLNGAIYISEVDYFYQNGGFIGEETFAYIMPPKKSIDIDTLDDIDYATFLIESSSSNR